MKPLRYALIVVFLALSTVAHPEEIFKASIYIDGRRNEIRFTNIEGESFVSWSDLALLLPGMFSLSEKGEILVDTKRTAQPTVEELLRILGDSSVASGDVIESRIDGEFTGWDGETIFKLVNGQIWQQAEYAYTYTYKYMPKVTIYKSSSGWKMKVEGMSREIRVTRLR